MRTLTDKVERLVKEGDEVREREQAVSVLCAFHKALLHACLTLLLVCVQALHRVAELENDIHSKAEAMESLSQSDLQR